jgi:hypothetical protein
MRRLGLLVGSALLAACGATSSPSGVATNPADLPGGGALHSASAQPGATNAPQTSGVRTVLAPLGLNLRAAASASAQVLGTLAQGTELTVVGYNDQNGGWYHVKSSSTTGWITANTQFSSPHHFTSYHGDRGFTALFLESWTFAENPNSVVFRPQSGGGQAIVVQTAQSIDQLGPAGRDGYTLSSTDSVEVFGVTGVLRQYNRTGTANVSPGPDSPPPLSHLAEVRLVIDSQRAMRLDFAYDNAGDLQQFTDFYNSVAFAPPSSPGASASPGASPSSSGEPTSSAVASPTPL